MLEYDYNLLMVQLIIIVFLLGVVIWFVKVNKISELERRYKKFCLEPLNDNSIPILSRVMNFYNNSKIKLSKYLIKSQMLKDYSRHYKKVVQEKRYNTLPKRGVFFYDIKRAKYSDYLVKLNKKCLLDMWQNNIIFHLVLYLPELKERIILKKLQNLKENERMIQI